MLPQAQPPAAWDLHVSLAADPLGPALPLCCGGGWGGGRVLSPEAAMVVLTLSVKKLFSVCGV